MLAASSHDRNNDPESDHITVSIDVHNTAFLHADVDQDLFAEPPEPDEWYDAGLKEDEVWKLNKALYGYRKAPKLWHQHLVSVLESMNYHPLLTDPSCFRNDETSTNIFVHVDVGIHTPYLHMCHSHIMSLALSIALSLCTRSSVVSVHISAPHSFVTSPMPLRGSS